MNDFEILSHDEIEKIKQEQDFAIIPTRLINRIVLKNNYAIMEFHMPTDNTPYIHFVNSEYFVVNWGKNFQGDEEE